jgi:hypothetical protein
MRGPQGWVTGYFGRKKNFLYRDSNHDFSIVQLVVTVSNIFVQGKLKGKGKIYPRIGHEGPEGE